MPEVRYTAAGGHYLVGGHGFDPGDVREVDAELADYLADHEDFEVVSEDDTAADDSAPFDFDPVGHDDFETNGWLDNDYQDRAEAVRAGGLDDYLKEIEDAERSDTVLNAVEERRSELEG
jgi:hypothetical protein